MDEDAPRTRLTDAERQLVRRFVMSIYARWAEDADPDTYVAFAAEAGVSDGNFSAWRAKAPAKKRTTPSALDLMKLLRAIGVLGRHFELPGERERPDIETLRAQVAALRAEAEEVEAEIRRLESIPTVEPEDQRGAP